MSCYVVRPLLSPLPSAPPPPRLTPARRRLDCIRERGARAADGLPVDGGVKAELLGERCRLLGAARDTNDAAAKGVLGDLAHERADGAARRRHDDRLARDGAQHVDEPAVRRRARHAKGTHAAREPRIVARAVELPDGVRRQPLGRDGLHRRQRPAQPQQRAQRVVGVLGADHLARHEAHHRLARRAPARPVAAQGAAHVRVRGEVRRLKDDGALRQAKGARQRRVHDGEGVGGDGLGRRGGRTWAASETEERERRRARRRRAPPELTERAGCGGGNRRARRRIRHSRRHSRSSPAQPCARDRRRRRRGPWPGRRAAAWWWRGGEGGGGGVTQWGGARRRQPSDEKRTARQP